MSHSHQNCIDYAYDRDLIYTYWLLSLIILTISIQGAAPNARRYLRWYIHQTREGGNRWLEMPANTMSLLLPEHVDMRQPIVVRFSDIIPDYDLRLHSMFKPP